MTAKNPNIIILMAFVLAGFNSHAQYDYSCEASRYSIRFDGTSSCVIAQYPFLSNFSLTGALWLRMPNTQLGKPMGLIYRNTDFCFFGLVLTAAGELKFEAKVDAAPRQGAYSDTYSGLPSTFDSVVTSGLALDANRFYHVAFTYDEHSKQCSIWVNGVVRASKILLGQIRSTYIFASLPVYSFGAVKGFYGYTYSDYFTGYIDNVVIANDVLTKPELDLVAKNEMTAAFCTEHSIATWTFEEGTGVTSANTSLMQSTSTVDDNAYINACPWVKFICSPFPVKLINPYPEMIDDNGSIRADLSAINLDRTVIGAATDGISKILVVAKTAPNKKVQFLVQGAGNGSLSSLDLITEKQSAVNTISNNDGYSAAIFNAPDGYGSNFPAGGRDVPVFVYCFDNASDPNAFTSSGKNIRLVTPPVVLVHGMWSKPDAWNNISNVLSKNFKIGKADYSEYGASSFSPNDVNSLPGRNAVREQVLLQKKDYNEIGIVTCQVDVVAHSLGGLMTRSLSQEPTFNSRENYFKGSIHRLITLGTPHKGSPLGPELLKNRTTLVYKKPNSGSVESIPFQPITLEEFLKSRGKPIGQVHEDFMANSEALKHLNTTKNIDVHAIVGDWKGDNLVLSNDVNYIAYNKLFKFALGKTHDEIFGMSEFTDCIVAEGSQLGGLDKNSTYVSKFSGTVHSKLVPTHLSSDETDNPAIIYQIGNLLTTSDKTKFSNAFPKPVAAGKPIQSKFTRISKPAGISSDDTSYVYFPRAMRNQIINLNGGDSVKIKLSIAIHGNLLIKGGFFMMKDGDFVELPKPATNQVDFLIPPDLISGTYEISVLVRDTIDRLFMDTVRFKVENIISIDSLSVYPKIITLDSNVRSTRILINGYYKTNNTRVSLNLTESKDVSYIIQDTSIISVDSTGEIVAKKPGLSTIQVKYKNLVQEILVTVTDNFALATRSPAFITFPQPPDVSIYSDPATLQAASSNYIDIRYTVLGGPVTLSESTLFLRDTGLVSVKASLPGDAYFDSAAPVIRSFRITNSPVYVFAGTGDWSNTSNWKNNLIPPSPLPAGSEIIINPVTNGECVLNINQIISKGARLTIKRGISFTIENNLTIQ
jgi:pimeloyl-ACP methyl ester carboxylesterase